MLILSESSRFVFVYIRVRCEGIESFISITIVKLSFDPIYLEIWGWIFSRETRCYKESLEQDTKDMEKFQIYILRGILDYWTI